jgi:hypothetical protein
MAFEPFEIVFEHPEREVLHLLASALDEVTPVRFTILRTDRVSPAVVHHVKTECRVKALGFVTIWHADDKVVQRMDPKVAAGTKVTHCSRSDGSHAIYLRKAVRTSRE